MDRRSLPIFAFAAVFFGVTGHWFFTPLRYYMPLLVLGCVVAGWWQESLLESSFPLCRRLAWALVATTLAYTALFSVQTVYRYAHETRMQAGLWLDRELPKGGAMLNAGFNRYMALPSDPPLYIIVSKAQELQLLRLPDDASWDLIQITSLQYQRHYRHGNATMTEAYDRLRNPNGPFALVARFESHFINKRLYMKLDPMFEGYFVSPTIEFYRAKHPRAGALPNAVQNMPG